MDLRGVEKRIVREIAKGTAAFVRRHGDERVTCVAIDAQPSDDFFALCFDTESNEEERSRLGVRGGRERLVGNVPHHLFHEFAADIRAPREGWPRSPRGSKDGFIEGEMRGVLAAALRHAADDGTFAALPTTKRVRLGYCYHNSAFVLCHTLRVASPIAPRRARKRTALVRIDTSEKQDAFDRATPYFTRAVARATSFMA